MALVKALIEVDSRDWDPSRIPDRAFEVEFNPTEYTLAKGAQIAEIAIPGIDSPVLQFIRGQNEKLTLDLFFDTTEFGLGEDARDVRTLTKSFYELAKIQPKTHALPRITVIWGVGLSFRAIVESVSQKFTLFNPTGLPLRATLSVVFREYRTLEEQLKELNLQSSDHTRTYEVQRGDTAGLLAARFYGDPAEWRRIVEANEALIANPLRLIPGAVLRIPPIEPVGALSRRRS